MASGTNSLSALSAAEAYHERALQAIREAKRIVLNYDPFTDPKRFTGKRIAVALEEYLDDCGGRSSWWDCLEKLKAGGADLGSRPEANLRTVISTNRERFRVDGEDVMLVPRSSQKVA